MLRAGFLSALSVTVLLGLGLPVQATEIARDSFTLSFPTYANGGVGFAGPWVQGGFNAFASGYTLRERSLCHAGLETHGGSVAGDAFPAINGIVRLLSAPLGADNSTVYVGFRIQPRGTLDDGLFNGFFGLTLNGSLGNDLFIGKPGAGVMDQYVLESRGGAGQVPSGIPTVVGRTALLVVKAQFLAGNDVFTLYVNPSPRKPEPASNVVKSDIDLGTVSKIGIYSTGAFVIDEIRIGTTFADAVGTGHAHDEIPGCEDER